MSTEATLHVFSQNVEETAALARQLATHFIGGEVVVFKSDVGGGKTTFVKYLVQALGCDELVSSPTFTVSNEYKTPEYTIAHYDFYRLHDPAYVAEALQEHANDNRTICFIEWPETVGLTIQSSLDIEISKHPQLEDARYFTLQAADEFAYLLEGITV